MEIGERVVGGGPSLLNLFLTNPYKFLHRDPVIWVLEFLETKMKGIYKGFNKYISNMFVVKERELEIGYPTDVKHVAHIGWDGQNDSSAPSWMNEFKTSTGFSAKTVSDIGLGGDSQWNSKEIEQSMGSRRSDIFDASIREDLVRKKNKRKKIKSASSSPKASAKTTRAKPKQKFSNTVGDSLSCLDM